MAEARRTRELLAKVRVRYPAGFVYKVNDRTRSGIPDTVMVIGGKTLWVEFKDLVKRPRPIESAVTPIQRLTMKQMAKAGATVFVVAFAQNKRLLVWDHDLKPIDTHDDFFALLAYEVGF